jgi:hypothetical protein
MRILAHVESIDEALIDEDLGDPYLLFGRWHGNTLMTDRNSVADSGEHVSNGIGCDHRYHEAFLTPGSSPLDANSRTQIRHMPKSRMNARARPHRLQRL